MAFPAPSSTVDAPRQTGSVAADTAESRGTLRSVSAEGDAPEDGEGGDGPARPGGRPQLKRIK